MCTIQRYCTLINGTTHPWRHPVYVCSPPSWFPVWIPITQLKVRLLLSTPFQLHLQLQPSLTQLLRKAAAAVSTTHGGLQLQAVRKLHHPWGRFCEKNKKTKTCISCEPPLKSCPSGPSKLLESPLLDIHPWKARPCCDIQWQYRQR